MRADLHIHTTASDGTWDPLQVVGAVCRKGINFFAISDHDSVANVAWGTVLILKTKSCRSFAIITRDCWKKRMTTACAT